MPSVKIKELLLATYLYATLSANGAWALTINVTPTASPQTTLADLKKNPNTPVTLTQALDLLKDPTLRNLPLPAGRVSAARCGNWNQHPEFEPISKHEIDLTSKKPKTQNWRLTAPWRLASSYAKFTGSWKQLKLGQP